MADLNVNAVGANRAATGAATGAAASPPATAQQSLGQQDFLQLMIAQLQNQDPFKPMENGEFLGQMAQFSTVNGITELQSTVESLAAQFGATQLVDATSLIGRQAMILSDRVPGGEARAASVDVPAAGPLRLRIEDANGSLVQTLDLGERAPGRADFNLPPLPPGDYRLRASLGQGQGATALPVALAADIRGVALAGDGSGNTQLELEHFGSVSLNDVRHIRQET